MPAFAAPVPAAPVHVSSDKTYDILVADDNEDAAWALSQLLMRAGHRPRQAHSGSEAIAQAMASRPDVAVLDIGMPDMDGIEVARRLRAAPETAGMVLIALTGWGSEADRARALAAGFDALLSKPADLAELHAALAAAASKRHG
jgi:CheY-like chemotaxis protein